MKKYNLKKTPAVVALMEAGDDDAFTGLCGCLCLRCLHGVMTIVLCTPQARGWRRACARLWTHTSCPFSRTSTRPTSRRVRCASCPRIPRAHSFDVLRCCAMRLQDVTGSGNLVVFAATDPAGVHALVLVCFERLPLHAMICVRAECSCHHQGLSQDPDQRRQEVSLPCLRIMSSLSYLFGLPCLLGLRAGTVSLCSPT